jgi:heptosyltransferase-2
MSDNILIRGVNWIGDAVMTIPAIRSIKKAYPNSKISLLVKPAIAAVFEKSPDIDEIIIYEDRFKGALGKLKLASLLRKKKFSKAILLQNAFDAAAVAFLSGIPERIGYNRDGRGFLLTKPIAYNNEDLKMHHINYYLNMLEKSSIKADYSAPWIHISMDERISARQRLAELKRPILGINPGAAYGEAKRWYPERFAEVANWFIKDTGGSVVIFGGANDIGIAEEIDKHINDNSLLLSGKTTVRELIGLTAECDVFLSNDSGPMHIGYAVGTPLAAIFGSTSPALTGPADSEHRVIKRNFKCSPCFQRECPVNDMKCMYAVASEDVYFAIMELLPSKKAVFFDRDGTLCKDAHYMNKKEDFEVFPEIQSLGRLKEKGFMLIGVSNQSGIAKGIVDEEFVKDINGIFINKYGFDGFYYCRHNPDEHCSCRKPEPGMLFQARAEHKINLKHSYVVGDKDSDMLAARAVGAKSILVRTGKQQESAYADFAVSDLKDAVELIESHE